MIKFILAKMPNGAPLKILLGIEGLSSLVNQIFQVLLPWYILSSTGSLTWMGIAAFASLAPGIFAALLGGVIIDKFGRARTMFFCELLQFILITSIPVLIFTGNAYPALISGIILLSGFFDIPAQVARQALMPSYSRYAAMPLHRSEALKEAADGIMAVAGPLAGGFIIAAWGAANAWAVCAVLCLLITLLAAVTLNKRKAVHPSNTSAYKDVINHIKRDKFLMYVILFTLPLFILGESWELLILPTYVHTFNHGPLMLGLLEAAFGLGAFIGALYFAAAGKRFSFFTLLTVNYCAYIAAALSLIYNLPQSIVTAASLLSGLPFGAFGAMVITIILNATPVQLRTKTLGLFAASAALVESIFALIIGFTLEQKGLAFTLYGAVVIFVILIAAALVKRGSEKTPPLLFYPQQQKEEEASTTENK